MPRTVEINSTNNQTYSSYKNRPGKNATAVNSF